MRFIVYLGVLCTGILIGWVHQVVEAQEPKERVVYKHLVGYQTDSRFYVYDYPDVLLCVVNPKHQTEEDQNCISIADLKWALAKQKRQP